MPKLKPPLKRGDIVTDGDIRGVVTHVQTGNPSPYASNAPTQLVYVDWKSKGLED